MSDLYSLVSSVGHDTEQEFPQPFGFDIIGDGIG